MLSLDEINRLLGEGRYHLSDHALGRIVERNISREMIREAGIDAEIIEDYPDDKYSPSCLLLGFTRQGVPLHIHVSRVEQPTVKIVTVYVPEQSQWEDGRYRRRAP